MKTSKAWRIHTICSAWQRCSMAIRLAHSTNINMQFISFDNWTINMDWSPHWSAPATLLIGMTRSSCHLSHVPRIMKWQGKHWNSRDKLAGLQTRPLPNGALPLGWQTGEFLEKQ